MQIFLSVYFEYLRFSVKFEQMFMSIMKIKNES